MIAKIARNVSSLYIVRGTGVLIAIALFPYVVSRLTLTEVGIWVLIGSISFVIATSDFGMGITAVRYVSAARARGDHDEANRVLASTVAFFGGLGLLAAVVLVTLFTLGFDLFSIPEAHRGSTVAAAVITAVLSLLIGLPLGIFRQVLVGLHRMDLSNAAMMVQILGRAALIVVALETGLGVVGVVAAEAISVVLAGGVALLLCRREAPQMRAHGRNVRAATLRGMAPYSLRVFALSLGTIVVIHSGTTVVGVLLPVAVVAVYSAAFRISQVCRDITGALFIAVVPEAARASAGADRQSLRRILLRGTRFANAVIIALVVPVMLLAEPLLLLWVGADFAPAAPVVQLLLAGMLISNNHIVGVGLLTGAGRVGPAAGYTASWAVASVGLSFVLIPAIGLEGVALAIGLPLVVLEPLYVRAACREAGVSVGAFVREAVLVPYAAALPPAGVAALAVAVWLPSGVLAVAAVAGAFVAAYLAIFLRIGLDDDERRLIAGLVRRSRTTAEPAAATPPP